jgi:hypothetical protein
MVRIVSPGAVLAAMVSMSIPFVVPLTGCASEDACADGTCAEEPALDESESAPGASDRGDLCERVCEHLAGNCGWGFAAIDGEEGGADEDNCRRACEDGAFSDEDTTCLVSVPCAAVLKVCLDRAPDA